MNNLIFFIILSGLLLFILTIVNMMISLYLNEKHELIEKFEKENNDLNEKLENKINFQKSSLSLLRYAMKEALNVIQRVPKSIIEDIDKTQDVQIVIPHEMEVVPKNLDLSKLNKNEKELGNDITVVNNKESQQKLISAMKKIGLKPTEDMHKNYCLFRSAVGYCSMGRKDCRDYCEQDKRGLIWG